ncbi:hypothetical protein HG531_002684 [Fusarium graminearum]|nr:hypothetical protein HG531_002684 [Fusarium graminearum]
MLIGQGEVGRVNGLVVVGENGLQWEAPEGRQHGEFKLDLVVFGSLVGLPGVPGILGQGHVVRLECVRNDQRKVGWASTYNIILDAVSRRVGLVAAIETVLNAVDSQNTQLLESPSSHVGDKLTVSRELRLAALSGNLCVKSLVLEHLSGANDSNARRVASLEDGDEVDLCTSSKQIISLNGLVLVLGVVDVGRRRGSKNRRDEFTIAESVTESVRNGEECARYLKVVLSAREDVARGLDNEDVVVLGGGNGVVREVVDDLASALLGDHNLKLHEGGVESGRHDVVG